MMDMSKASGLRRTRPWGRRGVFAAWAVLGVITAGGAAWGQAAVLREYDFETIVSSGAIRGQDDWQMTGDWRFRENSPCLPNELGYNSPITALVFDFGTQCSYRNNRTGFATLVNPVELPITAPSASLVWRDFVGAETGRDFYFVQLSTDGGLTWTEVFRDSKDELFWDEESVDLTPYIGQTIRVRFGFSSDTSTTNFGWYVDDVKVVVETLAPGVSALALGNASLNEAQAADTDMLFTLLVSPKNTTPITLEHATLNGTAVAGLDFIATSGPLTLNPADMVHVNANTGAYSVPVTIINDAFFESTETFTLVISNPSSNAVITIGAATGTILDNEQLTHLYTETFETPVGTFRWTTGHPNGNPAPAPPTGDLPALRGLWDVVNMSTCLAPTAGFVSPTHALVFNNQGTLGTGGCGYYTAGGIEGFARMINSEPLPLTALAAQLSFHHYLSISYNSIQEERTTAYVEVSVDNGNTWETVRTFRPETPSDQPFVIPWREEVVSLNKFIGQAVMVRFRFAQPASDTPNTAQGWFIDDLRISIAPLPSNASKVTVLPAEVTEGNFGTKVMSFDVHVLQPQADITLAFETLGFAPGDVISFVDNFNNLVSVTLTEQTIAQPDVDFVDTSSQITIPGGAAFGQINVLLIGDDQPEADREYFQLRVTSASQNAFLVNNDVLATILNDDAPSLFVLSVNNMFADTVNAGPPPSLTPTPIQVAETAGVIKVDVQLVPARSVPITVFFTTEPATAFSGDSFDFLPAQGTLTFPANTDRASFFVTILDDLFPEDAANPASPDPTIGNRTPEEFRIKLSTTSPYASSRDTDALSKVVRITDDDSVAPAGFSVALITGPDTATTTEGSCSDISAPTSCGEMTTLTFEVTLEDPPSTANVEIDYVLVGLTATAGEDFEAASGTLTFMHDSVNPLNGETSKTLDVHILADRAVEGDEKFQLVLTNPRGTVFIVENTVTITIRDDDYLEETFGAEGSTLIQRSLNDPNALPAQALRDAMGNPAAAEFAANEFRSFDFHTLYGWDDNDDMLKAVNLGTFVVTPLAVDAPGLPGGAKWTGLAYDHTNGVLYATNVSVGGSELRRLDLSTDPVTATLVPTTSTPSNLVAIAVHPTTGRIYGFHIDTVDNAVDLYRVVPGKWDWELLGRLQEAGSGGALQDVVTGSAANDRKWDADFHDTTGKLFLNMFISGDRWVTREVDFDELVTKPLIDDPIVSALAIATPPPPASVRWTRDLHFAPDAPEGVEIKPAGLHLVADPVELNMADAGLVVSGVGDVNNDGFEDFIISAKNADVVTEEGIRQDAGAAYLFYGSPDAARLLGQALDQTELTFGAGLLDGTKGVVFTGTQPSERLGTSVSGVGDVNGDGIDDFALGFIRAIPGNSRDNAGGTFIVFGSIHFPASIPVTRIGDASISGNVGGVRIDGVDANDLAGFSIAGAGDFNNDGLADVIIGAPDAGTGTAQGAGAAYLIFGSVTSNFTVDLRSVVPPRGLRILGPATGNRFGESVSGAGDVNGDGVDDVVIGAPNAAAGAGEVYVFFGHRDFATTDAPKEYETSRLNQLVSFDGGATFLPSLSFTSTIPGKGDLSDFYLSSVTFTTLGFKFGQVPGVRLRGQGGQFGISVAGVGDVNGDGRDDIAVGAPVYDGTNEAPTEPHWGKIYLLEGRGAFPVNTAPDVTLAANIGDTVDGIVLRGIDGTGGTGAGGGPVMSDGAGLAVAGAGDLNGDGFMDVIVGAKNAVRESFEGEAYVLFGKAGLRGAMSLRDLANPDPRAQAGLYFYNTHGQAGFAFGRAVAAAGDFDNDGIQDVVVGRADGAFVFYGDPVTDEATYRNILFSEGNALSLDAPKFITKEVGRVGDKRSSRPASGVRIGFIGGGTGANADEPSTQTVTVFRRPSPDVVINDAIATDDDWIPAKVFWKVETNRNDFGQSLIEFYYRPEDIAGLNPNKLKIFYAKADQPLSSMTAWETLSVSHDTDRRVFRVERQHKSSIPGLPGNTDPNAPTPQQEFNGFYALIQADLLTELGNVIPMVGVTSANVAVDGPIVTPPGLTFWHETDKRLYATGAGIVSIRWRDNLGNNRALVRAENRWPSLTSGKFQTHVAGGPPILLEPPADLNLPDGSDFVIQDRQLAFTDPNVVLDTTFLPPPNQPANLASAVRDNHLFAVKLNTTSATAVGRSLIMLGDKQPLNQSTLYFQFVKTVNPEHVEVARNGTPGNTKWPIGTVFDDSTDALYAANHDDTTGSPFVLHPQAPFAPATARYPGFYVRNERRGSIVPINTFAQPMRLLYYKKGQKLLSARTGAFVGVHVFAWPQIAAAYTLDWPADNQARKIIIASQQGSKEISPQVFGTDIDVYVQNNPALGGFNPNEEHALIAGFGAGQAVFALRDDLNGDPPVHSRPFVFMTYNDPHDVTPEGVGKAKMLAFKVQATGVDDEGVNHQFMPNPNLSLSQDPYKGEAGAFILPPYPLSLFAISRDNDSPDLPAQDRPGFSGTPDPPNVVRAKRVFKDKNKSLWAKSQGDIVMRFFYPLHPDFFIPPSYNAKFANRKLIPNDADSRPLGDIPFLDGGITNLPSQPLTDAQIAPRNVMYRIEWPALVPEMNIGEILLEARQGLPQINGQCSVDFIFEETPDAAKLIDPIQPRIARDMNGVAVPAGLTMGDFALAQTSKVGGEIVFPALPPALAFRLRYDEANDILKFKGILVDPVFGFDYVLLNVMSEKDKQTIKNLPGMEGVQAWSTAVDRLAAAAATTVDITNTTTQPYEALGLTTGASRGVGFLTLAFQNAEQCGALPVSLEIIKIVPQLTAGRVAVVKPDCVFEEKLTLISTNDFGGRPQDFEFQWLFTPDAGGTIPPLPQTDPNTGQLLPGSPWGVPPTGRATSGPGINEIIIQGPGILTLSDNWFTMRYRYVNAPLPALNGVWSDWTNPQLGESWIKRVVGAINPFTQRASQGGIAGAEASFASFGVERPNAIVSMISQAGERSSGSVPLNCDNLDSFGLIQIYTTVLKRGMALSINALSPLSNPNVNQALLLVASRLADLYALLGNEAFADAADPTIGFGTDDGVYGEQATSIHAFMNQTSNLLEEELALLRGRDDTFAPSIRLHPTYNRLVWNFSRDITGGEVAYALNYNIKDQVQGGDGFISEADAKRLYPQGHGDAWGHYLTSLQFYYTLLTHPFYGWLPRSEAILVGGEPLTVDYLDERKFAQIASRKAQAGAEIVNLTYRQRYSMAPEDQHVGYKDSRPDRAWGFAEWASRAGQGAYLDWVVTNAILPAVDPNPTHEGIQVIDRRTVLELPEIASAYRSIEATADMADLGLNPLGLATSVIPFDISPSQIDDGQTHFEQIFNRALTALNNAAQVFNFANNSTQLLRRQADSQEDFERAIVDQENDFKARLIEIFGYPYAGDIGPGKTYASGYDGPDLFLWFYREPSGLTNDGVLRDVYFKPPARLTQNNPDFNVTQVFNGNAGISIPSLGESMLAAIADNSSLVFQTNPGAPSGGNPIRLFQIGSGDVTFEVDVMNLQSDFNVTRDNATDPRSISNILQAEKIRVQYNMSNRGGRFGVQKPPNHGERRAPGEIQIAIADLNQALARLMIAVDDYGGFVGRVEDKVALINNQFAVDVAKVRLKETRLDGKKTVQDVLLGLEIGKQVGDVAIALIENVGEVAEESVPTVTGIIVGFSNGIIIDGLAPARGALKGTRKFAIEVIKFLQRAADLVAFRLQQEGERKDDQLSIDTDVLDKNAALFNAIKELEDMLRSEVPLRVSLHSAYDAVLQEMGKVQKVLAEGERLLERRELFRRQTAAEIQSQRYRDMAFRVFRNEALQKYRAQFDLAARYVFLAAKAYDYETTLLSSDPQSGQRFLADIVRARQIGNLVDGAPQTGVGLSDAMARMARNFEVLSGQLGFNNPQRETNRFSLRAELFRNLPGPQGNAQWRELLNQDYKVAGVGKVDNLWDVPEFVRLAVPPAGFTDVEPGIVIPFSTVIEEGKNFFGWPIGGLDSSFDSTQFATKIRSVGVWFSNYDFLNFSNTPRVWLIPAGVDVLRSPTGGRGLERHFQVVDQVLPLPFPIGAGDLADPNFIPMFDGLSAPLVPVRRFGRLRAFHDSGEFSAAELNKDSRLIGRSVWNTRWMLIIPASTLSGPLPPTQLTTDEQEKGLDARVERFINGRIVNGQRDGNGVSDIKLYFDTYAYPRLKK